MQEDQIMPLVQALCSNESFRGVITYLENPEEFQKGSIVRMAHSTSMSRQEAMLFLEASANSAGDRKNMSTSALIEELKSRPGFFGVVVQALDWEASSIFGRTTLDCQVSNHFPREKVPEMLRLMAKIAEEQLKDEESD